MDTADAWIALAWTPGLAHHDRLALLDAAGGDPLKALDAQYLAGCGQQAADAVAPASGSLLDWLGAAKQFSSTPTLRWLELPFNQLIGLSDARYPQLLRQIPDPPVVLFVTGCVASLEEPQIAIVGSRKPSASGLQNTQYFATSLAGAGLCITSGLALGIDGAAHRAALDAGQATVAVMATGPDRVYPARHRKLAHEIAESGALVTEFACGAAPRRHHFARRNRLISGLSLGTVVIEGALRSGTLITARLAGEQGRDVFALPGPAGAVQSRGCHALIRNGALLVDEPGEIVESLGWLRAVAPGAAAERPGAPGTGPDAAAGECSHDVRTLLQHIGFNPLSVDELVRLSGLTAGRVCSIVSALELSGDVHHCGGGRWSRRSR